MKLAALDPEKVLRFAAMDPAIEPGQKSLWDDLVRYAQKELQAQEKGLCRGNPFGLPKPGFLYSLRSAHPLGGMSDK